MCNPESKKPEKQADKLYRRLVQVVERVLEQVAGIEVRLGHRTGKRATARAALFAHYGPLVRQVIEQTTRRVCQHQVVPALAQVVSLFEPHTAIIQRGKAPPHETEFGRKLGYSEGDGGIISEYRILLGNPPDDQQWCASLSTSRN